MDIDIDFADRNQVLEKLKHHVASIDSTKKHNTGVYFTNIPHDPITNLATTNYKDAEARGFFKVDFLNVSIYKEVKDNEHLERLVAKEPLWDLLEHKEFVDQVFHLAGHDSLLKKLKPRSVEELACVLAIIRPSKRYLENETWDVIKEQIWLKPATDEYFFKKAHSFSYAFAVVVHMNLLCEQMST